jgi:hypothetical protein
MAELVNEISALGLDDSHTKSRRFDKFKAKLTELFWGSSNNSNEVASPINKSSRTNNSGMLIEPYPSNTITNYYYGYKSQWEHQDAGVQAPNRKRITTSNGSSGEHLVSSSSSMSTSSSSSSPESSVFNDQTGTVQANSKTTASNMQQQQHNLSQQSSNRVTMDSLYDTSSLHTYNYDSMTASTSEYYGMADSDDEETINPFLNAAMTQHIALNSDLNSVIEMFEPHMHLIDGKHTKY